MQICAAELCFLFFLIPLTITWPLRFILWSFEGARPLDPTGINYLTVYKVDKTSCTSTSYNSKMLLNNLIISICYFGWILNAGLLLVVEYFLLLYSNFIFNSTVNTKLIKKLLPQNHKREKSRKFMCVSCCLMICVALHSSLHPDWALHGAGQNRREVLQRPNAENLAWWTQKDVLYLGQQSFYPLKSAARASLERLMTIDPQHKPPEQQTTVFYQSSWAVKSSSHTFWVFRLPLCPRMAEDV